MPQNFSHLLLSAILRCSVLSWGDGTLHRVAARTYYFVPRKGRGGGVGKVVSPKEDGRDTGPYINEVFFRARVTLGKMTLFAGGGVILIFLRRKLHFYTRRARRYGVKRDTICEKIRAFDTGRVKGASWVN